MQSDTTAYSDRTGDEVTFISEVRVELLKAVLEQGKPFRFRAPGFSMYPCIRNNDIITVAPLPGNRPCPGDIVAFIHPDTGKLTVHRVVKKEENAYLVRGDNSVKPDGIVPRANILGFVTRVERHGRDVRAGLGFERRLIAILSSNGLLLDTFRAISLPGTVCGAALRKMQGQAVYRRFMRNLHPNISIIEADEQDMHMVYEEFGGDTPPQAYHPDPLVTNFVAKTGKKVIGFIQLVRHPDSHYPYVGFWIFSLTVKTPYRGSGIGEELSKRVLQRAQDEGAHELFLLVNEKNQPAVALYRKLQFDRVTLPDLEEQLIKEVTTTGVRRVTMHRAFSKTTGTRYR